MNGKITDKELSDGLIKKINDLHDFLSRGGNIGGSVDVKGYITSDRDMAINSEEARFKNRICNRGTFVNRTRIGFFDWIEDKPILVVDSERDTASIHVNSVYFGHDNKRDNGYASLSNGMILQWGTVTLHSNGGWGGFDNVYLPLVFPTKCLSCYGGASGNDGWYLYNVNCVPIGNTAVSVQYSRVNNIAIDEAVFVRWTAIGY